MSKFLRKSEVAFFYYLPQLLIKQTKLYKTMIFKEIQTLEIKYRFKFYPYVVCGIDRKLYQLNHFKKRRTCYFKEIPYNKERNGYRINSQWVSFNRLNKFKIDVNEVIQI